ncbi:MAG: cellulose biosynthesis protein BcsS [Nitrospira sp.]|nr:cellulose biosynthesis protein BcsS [Nitrospira sp.]
MLVRCMQLIIGVWLLAGLPVATQAGDVFAGFQIDNKNQYFGYFGVRTPLMNIPGDTDLFAQVMTSGLGYSFHSNGRRLDANVQFIVPSLGIKKTIGEWTLSALAGPQMRRIEEQRLNANAALDHQIGAYGQVEALYWHEKGSLHAIASYADLDNFFWGRLRGKVLAHTSDKGCCATYVGWDVAGMGNADFRAVQTGPLVEVPVGKVFMLAKSGYQNSSSFHSGVYGGVEVYFPF